MDIEVKLPELGDGIASADVLELFVREGDRVEAGQDLVEIESEKSTAPIPSPAAGVVSRVHVREGQTVPVGGTLFTLASEQPAAETRQAPAAQPATATATPPIKPSTTTSPSTQADETSETIEAEVKWEAETAREERKPSRVTPPAAIPSIRQSPAPVTPVPTQPQPTLNAATATARPVAAGETIPAGPAVRRFAREVGVDLHRVHGTGPSGRITREDVLEAVRHSNQAPAFASTVENTAPESSSSNSDKSAAGPPSTTDKWGPIRIERMSKIRQTIAAQMHKSWESCPRVTNFDDADITELEKFRQTSKADYAARGIKLTTLPFVIKAVAMSLRSHPTLNASLDMENAQIIYKQYIHLGVAVDTDRGLVVPKLRAADKMSIPEIAASLGQIAENARTGNFAIEDLRGGTFTISNLGAIGGTYSTPIINVPEVAILLVGRARLMPIAIDEDTVLVRRMMPLSLSYDHRLVDGAAAARFLNDVIDYLRAPSRLLLSP